MVSFRHMRELASAWGG
ncbi:hypothetical protein [Nonomuraea sp. NPDC049709]